MRENLDTVLSRSSNLERLEEMSEALDFKQDRFRTITSKKKSKGFNLPSLGGIMGKRRALPPPPKQRIEESYDYTKSDIMEYGGAQAFYQGPGECIEEESRVPQ